MPGHVKTMLHLLASNQAVHSFGGQKVPKTGFLVSGSRMESRTDLIFCRASFLVISDGILIKDLIDLAQRGPQAEFAVSVSAV